MTTRARKFSILINQDWNSIQNKPDVIDVSGVTYEALDANGDVGSEAGQVARGNHDHEIGDVSLIFENALI